MLVIAHIGKIPVEEYAGFIVPVIALYAYGRAWSRRHRRRLARLPGPAEGLDGRTVELVLARWAEAKHAELGRELVPLMYPPGPEDVTASELAQRIGAEHDSVVRWLQELAELGYVEYDPRESEQVSLTTEGIHLLNITEEALLSALADPAASDPADPEHAGSR
jgi:DNA-binding transcriptional ArsR family regulator